MSWTPVLTPVDEVAAEAAFHGWPADSAWPLHARQLYDAIVALTHGRDVLTDADRLLDAPSPHPIDNLVTTRVAVSEQRADRSAV